MSNFVSAKVHKKVFGSATRKSIIVYFADKASDGGEGIWASETTIAAELEMHRATVIRTINDLVEDGILIVVGDRKHRNGATVEYDICMAAVEQLPDVELPQSEAAAKGLTRRTARPVAESDPSHSATLPVAQRDTMMSHSATQTILKPSKNLARPHARGAEPVDNDKGDEGFQRFWQAHPRPNNRDRTWQAWLAAKKEGGQADRIIEAATRYAVVSAGTENQYRVRSDDWLVDRRWEDFEEALCRHPGPISPNTLRWAKAIHAKTYVAPNAVSAGQAREMLSAGLVSTSDLRRIGLNP